MLRSDRLLARTDPWKQIITPIKARLQEFANKNIKLSKEDYETALRMMNTQTKHTYFFGKLAFFFTPASTFAQNWENRKNHLIGSSSDKKPEP